MQRKGLHHLHHFIAGFAIISTLIITIRQLSPIIGENIIIMGLVIATFIIGIYCGYKHYNQQLEYPQFTQQQKFLIISILCAVGLSYTFIDSLDSIIKLINPNINVLAILLIFLLIIILPIAYLIGKSKIVINNSSIIGLLLGSIITPIILMQYLGVQITIFIVFLMFIGISLENIFKSPGINLTKTINLSYLLIIPIGYYLNIFIDHQFFAVTNAYNNYKVIVNENNKILSINKSASSMIQQDTMQGFEYIELIKQILFQDLNLSNKNILILGAGGFSFTANGNLHNNKFTYVDIDPDLKNIVTKYFNNNIYGDFISSDAATFIKNATYRGEKYHAVISDVYSSKHIIPSHILNLEYFSNIKSILEPHGVAIFNIIATPSLNDNYSWDIDTKIRKIFPSCMSIPLHYFTNKVSNIIYVCNLKN